jgi:hypothetical protein
MRLFLLCILFLLCFIEPVGVALSLDGSGVNKLNKDSLQQIFSTLGEDDLKNLGLVCHDWYKIVSSDEWWLFLLARKFPNEDMVSLYEMAKGNQLKAQEVYKLIHCKHSALYMGHLTKEELETLIKNNKFSNKLIDYLTISVKRKATNLRTLAMGDNTHMAAVFWAYSNMLISGFHTTRNAAMESVQEISWIIDPQFIRLVWHIASFNAWNMECAWNSINNALNGIRKDNFVPRIITNDELATKALKRAKNSVLKALSTLKISDPVTLGNMAYKLAEYFLLALLTEEGFLSYFINDYKSALENLAQEYKISDTDMAEKIRQITCHKKYDMENPFIKSLAIVMEQKI